MKISDPGVCTATDKGIGKQARYIADDTVGPHRTPHCASDAHTCPEQS